MFDNIKIISFANNGFVDSQQKLKNYLNSIGVNNINLYTNEYLTDDYRNTFSHILKYERGYGYWTWKPYMILNELKKTKSDEILLYMDSSDVPHPLFFHIVSNHFLKNDYMFLNRGYNHGEWTKRDCFVLMGCDDKTYHESIQLEAGIIALKNTNFNVSFIEEWLDWCKNENIITDLPNICGLPDLCGFNDHRHDQSILTNLHIKHGLVSYNLNTIIEYNLNQ